MPVPNPTTGLIRDERYLDHRPGAGHPESPRRLEAIYAMLDGSDLGNACVWVEPRMALEEEILHFHTRAYLDSIIATSDRSHTSLTPDTGASSGSYTAARLAVGGVLTALESIMKGGLTNAFVLARPPGHHAESNRAFGYCLFNNAALGALYARMSLGLDRALIVDWDLHHGNGTQHAFEEDPHVFYFSTHQYPLFPGTGIFTEVGRGPGEGYTMNIPLPRRYGDGEYLYLLLNLLRPVAMQFKPDIVIVSAGFDIHHEDPLGGMAVTPKGFAAMTRVMMEIAEKCCHGRLVLVLEGGYNRIALATSILSVVAELSGKTVTNPQYMAAESDPARNQYALHRCIHVHRPYWKCLQGEKGGLP